MPIAPFAPGPGQAVAWAFPTIAETGASDQANACSHYSELVGGISYLCGGDAIADLNGGTLHAFHLGFWNEWRMMRWRGFTAPGTIGVSTTIVSIHPVVQAAMWDGTSTFNSFFHVGGNNTLISAGSGVPSVSLNGPPALSAEPATMGTYYRVASIGSSISDITSASIIAQFYSTGGAYIAPPTPAATLVVNIPALAIYYEAPVMPIGHAANCNAYDPITLQDGATTPPGNGLLIS